MCWAHDIRNPACRNIIGINKSEGEDSTRPCEEVLWLSVRTKLEAATHVHVMVRGGLFTSATSGHPIEDSYAIAFLRPSDPQQQLVARMHLPPDGMLHSHNRLLHWNHGFRQLGSRRRCRLPCLATKTATPEGLNIGQWTGEPREVQVMDIATVALTEAERELSEQSYTCPNPTQPAQTLVALAVWWTQRSASR